MSLLAVPSTVGKLPLPRWLPLLLVVVLAIVIRHTLTTNLDVSWGLTMADKVLSGERLYVDIIEVNPPATVFLYIVPAMLGQLLGLSGEFFVDALVFLAVALSLLLVHRILRPVQIAFGRAWILTAIVAAALLILPMHTFGEREHFASITFLPMLAVAVVRAKAGKPALSMLVAAGICGGFTAIIKPYFAIPIICIAAVTALHARSWRPIFALENWIAAGLLAVYAAAVVITYPQFIFDVMPMVMTVYLPARESLLVMLVGFSTPIWAATVVLIVLLKHSAVLQPRYSLLLAGSFGFFVAFYIQMKGWPYQAYPMLALALIALAMAVVEQWQREAFPPATGRLRRLASGMAAALIMGLTIIWMNFMFDPTALAVAVQTVKAHPKIIALSGAEWTGFPLTRMVGGTWVGHVSSLWITAGVIVRQENETLEPATERRLNAYMARDKTMFAEDVARFRPDVILVDRQDRRIDWMAWANSYPPLAAEMRHYGLYRSVDRIDILRRRPDR